MSEEAVMYGVDQNIATITLNRPDNRNSMTAELLQAFARVVDTVRSDRDVRCVVITGTGSCFSAGADFRSQVQDADTSLQPHERSYAMYEPFLSVLDIEVPVIGALNGHAVGGGFGLALVCDVRIGNQDAKYGANFVRLGLHPGMAISFLLPRLIGISCAAELLFTGQLIRGRYAAQLGILSSAVREQEVMPQAMQMARVIASNAPIAVRMTKRSLYGEDHDVARRAAFAEAFAQAQTLTTEDASEGMKALLEKREPSFHGR